VTNASSSSVVSASLLRRSSPMVLLVAPLAGPAEHIEPNPCVG
jgi:hypothetical protein